MDVPVQQIAVRRAPEAGKRKIERADPFKIQPVRRLFQLGFLAVTIYIGTKFILFVHQLEKGLIPPFSRPPGVEAFLPISALVSLKYWLVTGVFNPIHPSGLVLFLIILTTGLFLKKGFCGWICPFGLLSEYLARIHVLLFDRVRKIPPWLDYPLRSLKYLLLLFFLWAIIIGMNGQALAKFIYSPYNKIADVKMLKFFTHMSPTTLWTLVILLLLSILLPPFWCRYGCPYGALLGMLSWLSPVKIHRNQETCIDCDKCSKVCPARIPVHRARSVFSDECNACLNCIDACPVKDTLFLSGPKKKWRLPRQGYALILLALFFTGIMVARFTGNWHNKISTEEYRYLIQHQDEYHHNRGRVITDEPSFFQDQNRDANDERIDK